MNTAGRLLSIYDKLVETRRGNDIAMVKVWAEVFGLTPDSPMAEDDVVTCLQALRAEMDNLRVKLLALNAPENLMQPGLTRFRNVSSTSNLNAGWNGFRDEISKPENRLAFAWADWTLREDSEEDMHQEQFDELMSEIDSLEASLRDTEMSPYLRDFVQRQVDSIRSALRIYRVQGMRPIEAALHRVAGAYTLEKSRLETAQAAASETAKSVLSRMGGIVEKTAKVADQIDKIRKAGEGAYGLAKTVLPLLAFYVSG
jgi:hypothetical protein